MRRIKAELKSKAYKQLYYVVGEEDYLRRQFSYIIRDALIDSTDGMNYHYYTGKGISVDEVISMGETLPFLSERRVFLIYDPDISKSDMDKLTEYLRAAASDSIFIISMRNVDKRTGLYKLMNKVGRIVNCDIQDIDTLSKWLSTRIKSEGYGISEKDAQYLIRVAGTDMNSLSNEIAKLISYVAVKNHSDYDDYQTLMIHQEDIDTICIKQIENRIFDMIKHIGLGDNNRSIKLLNDLYELRVSSVLILSLLVRQFRILIQVRDMLDKGYGSYAISQNTGVYSRYIGEYIEQANRFDIRMLVDILESCANCEQDFKSGIITDKIGVELIIINVLGAKFKSTS